MTEPGNPYSSDQQSGNPIGLAAAVVALKVFSLLGSRANVFSDPGVRYRWND